LLLQQLYLTQFLFKKLTYYGRVLKPTASVALVRKVADEIRVTTFSKTFQTKKINETIVTRNKLTNNFVGLVTSGIRSDVATGRQFDNADLTY
jgi:hypothetical protein